MRVWQATLLILVILAQLSLAAPFQAPAVTNNLCSPISSISDYLTGDFILLFPTTLMVAVVFIALVKTLSGMFSMPNIDAWVKVEIREIIFTLILFVVAIAAVGAADLVVKGLTNVDCTSLAAQNAIGNILNTYTVAYKSIIQAMARLRFISSYSTYASAGFIFFAGISLAKYGGIYPLITSLSLATSALSNAMLLYKSIGILVNFFEIIVPAFLFPIAFSLRAFPLTRSLGNTLIAVAFGLGVFFPLAVILVGAFNDVIVLPMPKLDSAQLLELLGGSEGGVGKQILSPICKSLLGRVFLNAGELPTALGICAILLSNPFTAALFAPCFELIANVIYPIVAAFASLFLSAAIMYGDYLTQGVDVEVIFNIMHDFLSQVNILIVISYFDILLIGLITIGGIRSLSTALGGEAYLPGVEKLI